MFLSVIHYQVEDMHQLQTASADSWESSIQTWSTGLNCTVEKINSYFIAVYYKSSIKCRYLSLLCMHCVLCPPHCWCGVSMASPAIAISSDTFNCPCFVDCSSTCDTVTLGHCSVLWHGHVGSSSARCSSGVDTATIWSPVNLRHRAGHRTRLDTRLIEWRVRDGSRWYFWPSTENESHSSTKWLLEIIFQGISDWAVSLLIVWTFQDTLTPDFWWHGSFWHLASFCSCSVTTLLLTK